jgi:hypothetical protein
MELFFDIRIGGGGEIKSIWYPATNGPTLPATDDDDEDDDTPRRNVIIKQRN